MLSNTVYLSLQATQREGFPTFSPLPWQRGNSSYRWTSSSTWNGRNEDSPGRTCGESICALCQRTVMMMIMMTGHDKMLRRRCLERYACLRPVKEWAVVWCFLKCGRFESISDVEKLFDEVGGKLWLMKRFRDK